MNIYQKLLKYYIFYVFISILLIVGFFSYSYHNLFNNFTEDYVQEKLSQVDFIIKKEKQFLEKITNDWAEWDDAYNFIQNRNKEFIKSNFGGGDTLLNLGIDGMIFLDKNLNLVYGRAVKNNKEIILKKLPPFNYKKNGFSVYLINNNIYFVYITDITNTNETKKYGKLVVYEILSKKIFEKNGFNVVNIVIKNKNRLYNIKNENLIIYYPLNNKIILALSIDYSKKLLIFEKHFLKMFLAETIVLILLFIFGLIFLKKIINDIDFVFNTLVKGLDDIRELEKVTKYKYFLKEFEKIASVFEKMYEKLYNYEEIYKILDEYAPFGVAIYRKNLLYANKILLNILNIDRKDFNKINPLDYIENESIREKIRKINQKRLNGEKITLKEKNVLIKKL
ncbi:MULTISPECIES: CHASE4 domain-containing protein [unclassified Lebetimonas]|uniref:CHASE4 domain-containing protein n=1 Tax=unclassified Lebetimonas TaxID=2648158 RepID=UPI0004649F56|nr:MULTISPECIES: CHASE4 domain-containing protein [unclassified Lebetimonas]